MAEDSSPLPKDSVTLTLVMTHQAQPHAHQFFARESGTICACL